MSTGTHQIPPAPPPGRKNTKDRSRNPAAGFESLADVAETILIRLEHRVDRSDAIMAARRCRREIDIRDGGPAALSDVYNLAVTRLQQPSAEAS